jgi:endoglycosylceramidase
MLFTEQPPEAADFQKIRRWGFNVIRFPVSWEFIEPERDQIDEGYLQDWVEPVFDYAAREGIGVILDMHQWNWSTCFSPPDGGGAGVPQWALPEWTRGNCPYEGDDASGWMTRAAAEFWQDADMRGEYMELWEMIARRYKDEPAVVAYDLFNEPWPDLALPPEDADRDVLQPFYEELIGRIRAIDATRLIIYEPHITWDLFGNQFTSMPFDNIVYSTHLYSGGTAGGETGYNGDSAPLLAQVQRSVAEAESQGVPLLVGEFGIGMRENYQAWIRDEFRFQEQHVIGGTWWSMRQHDNTTFGLTEFDTRAEKRGLLDLVSRPYPVATAGDLISFSFDEQSRTLTMTFANNPDASGETLIAIPKYQYPGGIKVTSPDPGEDYLAVTQGDEYMRLTVDPARPRHTIVITPID